MSDLNDDELERYARHIVLPQVGGLGQRRLKAASILVVGAGGVASGALPALAGAGIGRLTIVDDDTVGRSNLQRQWLFRDDQLGQSKARLAAIFLEGINPAVNAVTAMCVPAKSTRRLCHTPGATGASTYFSVRRAPRSVS